MPPNAPVQRRAAQRTVRWNRLLDTLVSSRLRWVRNLQYLRDLLKAFGAPIRFDVEPACPYLLPRAARIVVLPNERCRECVELWLAAAGFGRAVPALPEEVADVQEGNDQEVERRDGSLLDRKTPIRVCREAALHLNSDLPTHDARVRMDTDQVVPLVVRRRLVGEDVSSKQVAHDEMLGTQ